MSPEARNFAPIEHPQESSPLESGKSLGSKFRYVRKRRTRLRPIGVRCNMGDAVQERRLNFWREADNFFKIIRPPNSHCIRGKCSRLYVHRGNPKSDNLTLGRFL
jgi:hypothetical protein